MFVGIKCGIKSHSLCLTFALIKMYGYSEFQNTLNFILKVSFARVALL